MSDDRRDQYEEELESARRHHLERAYGGPYGLGTCSFRFFSHHSHLSLPAGDPTDRTLRHVEAEKYIPKLIREELNKRCKAEFKELYDCIKRQGDYSFYSHVTKCNVPKNALNACFEKWARDPELHEEVRGDLCDFFSNEIAFSLQVTERYLEDRALFRATGLSKGQRRVRAYEQWKKEQEEEQKK